MMINLSQFTLEEITTRGRTTNNRRQKRPRRDLSSVICYTCDEKGHYSRNCPRNKGSSNKKTNKKRHHAHITEEDEPEMKRTKKDYVSDEEYVM